VSTRKRKTTLDLPEFTDSGDSFFKKPSMDNFSEKKSDMPEGLWQACPACSATVHELELAGNLRVCPKCEHHFTMSSPERVQMLCDEGSFVSMDDDLISVNVLGFKNYTERAAQYREKTGLNDAVLSGRGTIEGQPVTIGIMDFRFLGASMGSVVGEKLTRAIEAATAEKRGCIIISSSGGARMHEGILSLMQMAKTSGALARHQAAGLPFISVLTHPTTGGVTASFATLGDIIIAEPKCMIGFAGPRVVKETTHQDLPPGFQTAEFMLEHGLVDRIVTRKEMREMIGRFLHYLMPAEIASA
jgi:acetyl-CoA carboxylase carboxyl transferase subunit beta